MAHGKIDYLEIPAKTAEASADFYARIFGWNIRKRPGDGELAFDDPGGVSGTWVKESDRTPDERTRIYITVDDIAKALQQIQAAGGRVLTVVGTGASFDAAIDRAYDAVSRLSFTGMQYRRDIGQKALA